MMKQESAIPLRSRRSFTSSMSTARAYLREGSSFDSESRSIRYIAATGLIRRLSVTLTTLLLFAINFCPVFVKAALSQRLPANAVPIHYCADL